ncbi:hypothetical protein LCGC14_0713990 [marine sediment metagenome]|uniref:Uncharacterized protein n=1 Tax=marine sediment metagenome TaxID=412755 RepID=A0A0F9QIR0_9ZZZZ
MAQYGHIPMVTAEYKLYKGLADILMEFRPDLLPKDGLTFTSMKYFTPERLGKILSQSLRRNDKKFIWEAIHYRTTVANRYLVRSGETIESLIRDAHAKSRAFDVLNKYEQHLSQLLAMGLPIQSDIRPRLYGAGFVGNTQQTQRLRLQTYGLDGITGRPVVSPSRHHMDYDKSKTADKYLLYIDQSTNVIMRPARAQRFLGGPVVHNAQSIYYMEISEKAKESFLRDQPNPEWLDGNSIYYRPRSTRDYYWRKYQVSLHGIQWLNSPQVVNPPPLSFMPYLNIGPQ